MKYLTYLLILIIMIITLPGYSQKGGFFPYKGGIETFSKDFSYFFHELGKTNDTACVYFIVISLNKKDNSIFFEMSGSNQKGLLYDVVNRFFQSTANNWDISVLKKNSVVVPFFISAMINPFNNHNAFTDWPDFTNSNTINCRKCLITTPFSYKALGYRIID
jgi:hypothetical protein